MVRVHEIKLKNGESEELLKARAEKKLRLASCSISDMRIVKESVDAREKPVIYRVYSLDIASDKISDEKLLSAAKKAGVKAVKAPDDLHYHFPEAKHIPEHRPVVCGFGPCGMFAALTFALYGLKPIVLERGPAMEDRVKAVEHFWSTGELDPEANVQFGEGGAGTFSDGKLTTGTRDPAQRFILETLVEAGADPAILYRQKPHIGTDVLRNVVVNILRKIESLGGEVRFGTRLSAIETENGQLKAAVTGSGERIECDVLVFGTGHSARDTVRYFSEKGLLAEQKPFSMGVRVEHTQKLVDRAQFSAEHGALGLPAAEYKLNVKTGAGRGVYTFCMCPGGQVVASASHPGLLVTNGMSNSDRSGENANSALLVDVRTSDFGSEDPLAGLDFQEKYEKLAFELGGGTYTAPAQTVGSFLGHTADSGVSAAGPVPTYRPGVRFTDIRKCLPDFVSDSIEEALPMLDRKLRGFADPSAVMTAIESRSSSPLRFVRNEKGEAVLCDGSVIKGLYPGGEGAGYAGGIMSAAADGIHLAENSVI